MGIAGSVLSYAKALRRELFRASTVASNMVETSLLEGFLWNCTGNGLIMSQLCLGEPSFMPLFGFELVCSSFWIWLNYTEGWSTCNVFCVFLFQRKKYLWTMKKKASAIAMWISNSSYKEEEFWEERTFLWNTRTRKFIGSYLQDQTSELQEPSPVYKLRLTMSKSLQF